MAAKATAPGGARRRPSAQDRGEPAALPPPVPDGVIRLDDAEPGTEPERVAVFSIGSTVYTVPAEPPVSLALKALDLQYRRGGAWAEVFIMREMLGETGYRALLDCKTLTRDQYAAITAAIRSLAFGDQEDDSPNP